MLTRCANPECGLAFDYHQGEFFRFHKNHAPDEPPPNTHSVQHFWLCGACSLQYTLEYHEDQGVILHTYYENAPPSEWIRLIATA